MSNFNPPTVGFHTNPERINRNGRPIKGYSLTAVAREYFNEYPEHKKKIIDAMVLGAEKGDVYAARLLWAYMDGEPQKKIQVTDGNSYEQMTDEELRDRIRVLEEKRKVAQMTAATLLPQQPVQELMLLPEYKEPQDSQKQDQVQHINEVGNV